MTMDKRVIVVSDLHIIGDAPEDCQCHAWDGYDVFRSASELADLIDWLDATYDSGTGADLELVLNGDSFDFPADMPSDSLAGDPGLARRRMEAAMDRVPEVCGALDRFLDSHRLTVIIGDRDTEMALPNVYSRFVEMLGAREGSVRFVPDGESCRIGRLWIEHGHKYDPWRIINGTGVKILQMVQRRGIDAPLTASDVERLSMLLAGRVGNSRRTEDFVDAYQIAAERLLSEHDIDLVVFGHTHQTLRAIFPNGRYMNTGTWTRKLEVPEECLADIDGAVEQLGACIEGILNGTFDRWVPPQLTYADIRLSEDGKVEAARLCEFVDGAGGIDWLS